jgi:hypothetical protein
MSKSEFEKASQDKRTGIVGEFFGFITENKKWFLIPLVVSMLLIGALVVLAGTGAAPFIYTLF